MDHEVYVIAAYVVTSSVIFVASAIVWLSGRSFRRRVKALAPPRSDRVRRSP